MKKILPILLLLFIISSFLSFGNAQIRPPYGGGLSTGTGGTIGGGVGPTTGVGGTIGEYYLNISGFSSPFSSISLYIGNVFIRGTVADDKGNFSISQVLIKQGLTGFCLKATDAKQLGTSNSCISFPATTGSYERKNLFIPPTLALSKNQISEGSSVTAYGYTMPGANVTLHISNGKTLVTKADSKGYFEFILKDYKAGKYTIFATAKYNNIDSLAPSNKLDFTVLSKTGEAVAKVENKFGNFWDKLWKLLTSWGLGPLWIAIPIIILIIILLIKLLPKRVWSVFKLPLLKWPFKLIRLPGIFYNPILERFFILFKRHKKTLHHKYFMGY
jgi:hypothetical protein